jgi:hypothetical protein
MAQILAFPASQKHQATESWKCLKTINIFFALKFKMTLHFLAQKIEEVPHLPYRLI